MKLVRLKAPGGLENLTVVEEDPPEPKPGELLVRIRACSLNLRDVFVVQGQPPVADGRIPLSDGAGEVIAVGENVDGFTVGDTVVSTFYPYWLAGEMTPDTGVQAVLLHQADHPLPSGAPFPSDRGRVRPHQRSCPRRGQSDRLGFEVVIEPPA